MDYYEILGVTADATTQDIKKAFRQIARECHPDVTGDDPTAGERFKSARKAYETLIDPVTRSRYDRRGQRRKFEKGSFFDAFYRATGEKEEETRSARPRSGPTYGAHDGYPGAGRKGRKDPKNDLDLDDLFNDFGFAGSSPSGAGTASPGADVHIDLDVPQGVAREGGTVTAVYHRLQRADSWRPGSSDNGLVRIQDIADIRIVPGTSSGEMLRERGLGDAGEHGGPYGDLVVRVCLVREPPPPPPPPAEAPRRERVRTEPRHAPVSAENGALKLDVSVVEALLGGRIELDTPQGRVRLAIPPGTSSGSRMRLKGKGAAGEDLYVETRIVVPRALDDESRQLIEAFARLNPGTPRD